MNKVRADRVLESVFSDNPHSKAVEQVAAHLGGLVTSREPAIGIGHDYGLELDHLETHMLHRGIVLEALGDPDFGLDTDPDFGVYLYKNYGSVSEMHSDDHSHLPTIGGRQVMTLRLHTASDTSGAYVLFANTAPANYHGIGDAGLFRGLKHPPNDEGISYGYDPDRERVFGDMVFQAVDEGNYDPTYTEPDVYHFKQLPLYSTLMRSKTSMGPVTAHAYRSINPSITRFSLSSDINVYSPLRADLPI